MTDTFLDLESSREDADPVELFAITTSVGQAYYLTSAIRDIPYDGRVYKATAMDCGEVGIDSIGDEREMQVIIAIDHPLVRRWTTYASPPKRTTVVCTRLHVDEGIAELWWEGEVTTLSWDEEIATLHIPSRMSDVFQRRCPNVLVSTTCTHVLYDGNCGVSKTGTDPFLLNHQRVTTVIAVNGRDVTVDLDDPNRIGKGWAERGTLTHDLTGETMTIGKQTDVSPGTNAIAILTMQDRIQELKVGDSVTIQRGCKNTILDCRDAFNNVAKFSGYPDLPGVNPFRGKTYSPWGS